MPPVDMDALAQELDSKPAPAPAPEGAKPDRGDMLPEAPKAAEVPAEEPKVAEKAAEKPAEEPKAAEKPAEEQPRSADGKFAEKTVPYSRFDEMNKKRKAEIDALNTKLVELSKRLEVEKGEDIESLEAVLDAKTEEYNKLMADGELAQAKTVMKEINKVNRRMAFLEIAPIATQHAAEVQTATQLEQLVDFYKTEFPIFDDASESFDQATVTWVAEMQGVFEAAGFSQADALQRSVDLAIPKFGLRPASAGEAAPTKPTKGEVEGKRKEDAVRRAVETSGKQPAALSEVGTDSDKAGMTKINPLDLSFDDFTKLPESTLKRLRGDLA